MTICDLYKWEIEDGPTYHLTSGQVPVTYDGDTYQPAPIRRGVVTVQSSGAEQKVEVQLPLSHELVRRWDFSPPAGEVTLTIIQYDGTTAHILTTARVAADKSDGSAFAMELLPVVSTGPRLPRGEYSTRCRWSLYGPGCRVDVESRGSVLGVVSVDVEKREMVLSRTGPGVVDDGFYVGGFLRPAGEASPYPPTGERRMIYAHTVGTTQITVTLSSLSQDLIDADRVRLYPGCDKTAETCREKFSNLPNFGGFPTLTTMGESPFKR